MLGVFEAAGFETSRARSRAATVEVRLADRADRARTARASTSATTSRVGRLAAAVLRAGARSRCVGASARPRLDRRRAVPQHPRGRLRRRRLPREPRAASRSPGVRAYRVGRRDPRRRRPRRHRRARPRRARRGAERARAPGVRALLRHLGGLRGDRARRARERQDAAARARARSRRPADRAELPRHRRRGAAPERHLRAARAPAGAASRFSSQSGALGLALLEEAGCARARAARRSSPSATRRTSRRTTCSSTGRTTRRPRCRCSTSSPSATRASLRASRGAWRARKPILAMKSGTTRAGARAAELAHRGARRLRGGRRRAVPPGRRDPRATRSRSCSTSRRCSSRSRCRAAGASRVLTNAGGLGILCADACEAAGLELAELAEETRAALAALLPGRGERREPRRHARLGHRGDATRRRCRVLLARPSVDAVIVLFVPPVVAVRRGRRGRDRARRGRARAPDKPVLAVVMSAEGTPSALAGASAPVAAFAYPESAARALGPAVERAEWLRRPRRHGAGARRHRRRAARARSSRRPLDAADDALARPGRGARALLDAYGIPLVPERHRRDPRGRGRGRRRARLPGRRQDRRRRARTRPRRGGVALDLADAATRCARAAERIGAPGRRPADGCAAAPSCSRASCRIRRSARSWPSGRAACSPS